MPPHPTVVSGDFNHDGLNDFVLTYTDSTEVAVYLNATVTGVSYETESSILFNLLNPMTFPSGDGI